MKYFFMDEPLETLIEIYKNNFLLCNKIVEQQEIFFRFL